MHRINLENTVYQEVIYQVFWFNTNNHKDFLLKEFFVFKEQIL